MGMAITPTPTFSLNERKKVPTLMRTSPIPSSQDQSSLGVFSFASVNPSYDLLTYPVLAFLLRRGSKTCTARPCNDYLALRAEDGTGRSPDASPVPSVPMVQDRQRRAEARRSAASAGQSSRCELALLRSTADLRGQARWGTALRGTEQSAALEQSGDPDPRRTTEERRTTAPRTNPGHSHQGLDPSPRSHGKTIPQCT
ncbi:uncharacterized protein LOC122217766 isoform X2 [Panthera leo]|uniref:uncharacterized protein LOC122217766 isoform X2 n=1 Tax=Panthera leo TaxID=9689 RepID=UPI001C6A4595|nr:uncharacterized protein LOC122217766 isoform X2 [Panthera leo]XP_042791168.1 uncharacterized protein LOC122217766 isoform X2 [Panthera leo]